MEMDDDGSLDENSVLIPSDITVDDLETLLKKYDIDPKGFSKELKDLQVELKNQDCFLYLIEDTNLVRMVQPVFVKVMYQGKTLVNTKDVILTRDNQERSRNSLLSEKMFPGETPLIASKRAVREELLLPSDLVEKSVSHPANMDRSQTNKMNSRSYEGLTSVYQKHLLVLEVLDESPIMRHLGLPNFKDFQTIEKTSHKTVEHFWTWVDDSVAKLSVTGANFDKIF